MNSVGSRSRRVASSWPSLTKLTPPSSSASRTDRASPARRAGTSASRGRRPRRWGRRPWRAAIWLIWRYRRARSSRCRTARAHASGRTDPLGRTASARTTNAIATSSAIPNCTVVSTKGRCCGRWIVMPKVNQAAIPTRPASTVRTTPSCSPSRRRAPTARPTRRAPPVRTRRTALTINEAAFILGTSVGSLDPTSQTSWRCQPQMICPCHTSRTPTPRRSRDGPSPAP